MCILIANLKHFYQRRGLYLLYVLGGLFTLVLVAALVGQRIGGEGEFAMLLIVAFFIGKMVGVMQMEVASKSFSFSLPGHQGMVRRLVFLAGVATSFALSLPWIAYSGLTSEGPAVIVLVLASGFSANLIVYLIGAAVTVRKTAAFVNGFFFAAIFLVYFEIGVASSEASSIAPAWSFSWRLRPPEPSGCGWAGRRGSASAVPRRGSGSWIRGTARRHTSSARSGPAGSPRAPSGL